MDIFGRFYFSLTIFMCIYRSKQSLIHTDPVVKEFVTVKRLIEDGFKHFDLTIVELFGEEHTPHSLSKRLRRSTTNGEPIRASFTSFGEKFMFKLQQSNVLHRSAKVVVSHKNGIDEWSQTDPDCYMFGQVTSHTGSASMHFCDGLMGAFFANGSHYRIDTIAGTSGEEDRVLVSKFVEDSNRSNSFICSAQQGTTPHHSSKQHSSTQRVRRETPTTVTIEVALYLDAYSTNMLDESGLITTEQKVRTILVTWNGVQAEYSKSDQLGFIVNIELKLIHFWTENPAWLTVGTSTLVDTLNSFTTGMNDRTDVLPYDLHFLYCQDDDGEKDGYAWYGSICGNDNYAVAKVHQILYFSLVTHEIGHALDMTHDGDGEGENGCVDDAGLMRPNGGSGYDWSSCNKAELEQFISSNPACIFEENIILDQVSPDSLLGSTLSPIWAGMDHTLDGLCQLKAGDGFAFRAFPYIDWGICDIHSCVDLTPGNNYGHMVNFNPNAFGAYCGEGKMCMAGNCKVMADSHLPASALTVVAGGWSAWGSFTSKLYFGESKMCMMGNCKAMADSHLPASALTGVAGGWSAWGSFTNCSRDCGTGLKVKHRICNNPRPQNSECDGLSYDAEVCNTNACQDDPVTRAELISARAREVCTWLIEVGRLEDTESTSDGETYTYSRLGQCEAWCPPKPGHTYPSNTRHGLMPDGTPCDQTTYEETEEEKKGFPTNNRGFTGRCIQGYCEAFDCKGKTGGKIFDGCGECGGDNTSCTIYQGIFDTAVSTGRREVIANLPVGAKIIQFTFTYSSMESNYLELWSETDQALLSPRKTAHWDTRSDPLSSAGTAWTFYWYDQYLHATGPVTEPVVIKLHNEGSNTNTGISYYYTVPLDPQNTTTASAPTTTDAVTTTSLQTTSSTISQTTTTATTTTVSEKTTVAPTTTTATSVPMVQCEPGSIHCHNGTCIPYSKICDGVKDCPENEDETYTDCSLFGMAANHRPDLVSLVSFMVIPMLIY